jgi:tetratricopeptide (TPR) repeat protein
MRSASILLASVLGLHLCAAGGDVRVWQGTLTLPAYEEGAPDRNPPFDQFSGIRFNYPYTLREDLTDKRADHTWRALFLENEYLKCSVLPDVGGHLYTCLDKISGQPMFYANPSIKKAIIGYRGAWAALGVEFNFPVSHNWVSMSPVVSGYANHVDGSASIKVGNIDRNYGMEWTVELVLRPGTTVLEQRVTLNNRSDVRHRFYWWNNAAIEVKDDSRVVYPMHFSEGHGLSDVDTWPVDSSGTDLSVIRNQTHGPVSRFVHGSREPFMGVWRPDTRTGTIHYADFGAVPGKKIWSFGADGDGLDWRKTLSDNNSAYVEVQAGLFRNQETFAFLEPRQTIRFSEHWMPVRGIGGFARANLAGVVNFTRSADAVTIGLNVNRTYPGASVRILDDGDAILDEKTNLTPERTWTKEIHPAAVSRYTFELRDGNGMQLLRHTEGEYDWTPAAEIHAGTQAPYTSPAPDQRTEDDWAEQGKNQELNGKLLAALDTYTNGLAKYPNSFALLKASGRLAASLLRYAEAVKYLEPVASRATSDPEIAYYLGLAYEGLGQDRKAQGAYETAARLPAFHDAGTLRLAELLARQGDLAEALELLRGITGDLRVIEERVALEKALGHDKEAQVLARSALQAALSLFLAVEMEPSPGADLELARFLAADPNRILTIAAQYMRLGLYQRALDLLSREYPDVSAEEREPGTVLPQKHPLVAYYRGYCRDQAGGSPKADYALAEKLSTEYIFPNGADTLLVLEAASRQNFKDATAQYLLGTLYYSEGLTDSALKSWENARRLNPRIPVLHASMGRALLALGAPERALSAFQEGLAADPSNVALYLGMDLALSLLERPARDRVAALERHPDLRNLPAELVFELALNRAEAGNFDSARALFRGRFFPRRETGTNVRQVWVEVKTRQALSLAQAGKCTDALGIIRGIGAVEPGIDFTQDGVGPFVESGRIQFLLGNVESRCGQREQAVERFKHAAEFDNPAELIWASKAARELGYDQARWRQRLEEALVYVEDRVEQASWGSWWLYAAGMIDLELGRPDSARAKFRRALLMPDRFLSYHLIRCAAEDHLLKPVAFEMATQ